MSRRKLKEISKESEPEKEEPCPECGVSAGIGVAFRICEMAEVEIGDVKQDLFDRKITVQDAIDKVKERLPDDFHRGLVEEVEQLMKEELEKATCISVIVQTKMSKQIDEMIENREQALENVDSETDFAKGTKELVENLKRSKQAIEKTKTCEAP